MAGGEDGDDAAEGGRAAEGGQEVEGEADAGVQEEGEGVEGAVGGGGG